MASLIDLFNPSFLMFLGILVLVVAGIVVYFESKFREQNHKFSSMLSLISSLAEELNTTKMVIQDISVGRPQDAPLALLKSINKEYGSFDNFFKAMDASYLEEQTGGEPICTNTSKLIHVSNDVNSKSDSNLIHVSDDENSESDSESEPDSDSESEPDSDSESESNNSIIEIGDNSDMKILKLNLNPPVDNDEYSEDESVIHNDSIEFLGDETNNDDCDNIYMDDTKIAFDNLEALEELSDTASIQDNHDTIITSDLKADLKSIHITLDESKSEPPDYKKMPLPKLRNVIIEKGLCPDASKLKKNELIKLLEEIK